jgi:ribonuclease BN (tRNA processing enzyme)
MTRQLGCAVALVLFCVLNCAGQQDDKTTRVVLLGTGNPNADPERSGPAVAIVAKGVPYIVDCGPGVVRRAAAAALKGIKELSVQNLSRLFVTHLHSDHTLGLPDIMLSPWILDRTAPLEVYGPKGISAMTRHILEAYREDIDIRRTGLEPSNDTGFRVNAHEIKPGVIFRDDNITVRAFEVRHGDWRYAYGYRFETGDRTIVISGDAAPTPAIAEHCNGCDVLVHEVYSEAGFQKRPPAWQKYHLNYHTSSRELAGIATKARPGLLVLYHQLFWGASDADLLEELRRFYAGRVVSGRDLDVY